MVHNLINQCDLAQFSSVTTDSESDHLVEEVECEQDLEGGRGEDADVGHHLGERDYPQHQYQEHPHLCHDQGHSQHHGHHSYYTTTSTSFCVSRAMRLVICPVVNSWRAHGARRNPFLVMVIVVVFNRLIWSVVIRLFLICSSGRSPCSF